MRTRAGEQLDLAVGAARVEVEQDDQPVVHPVAPDAPLVHQGTRVRFRLLRGDVVAAE